MEEVRWEGFQDPFRKGLQKIDVVALGDGWSGLFLLRADEELPSQYLSCSLGSKKEP